jgi:hypothetical protein
MIRAEKGKGVSEALGMNRRGGEGKIKGKTGVMRGEGRNFAG